MGVIKLSLGGESYQKEVRSLGAWQGILGPSLFLFLLPMCHEVSNFALPCVCSVMPYTTKGNRSK